MSLRVLNLGLEHRFIHLCKRINKTYIHWFTFIWMCMHVHVDQHCIWKTHSLYTLLYVMYNVTYMHNFNPVGDSCSQDLEKASARERKRSKNHVSLPFLWSSVYPPAGPSRKGPRAVAGNLLSQGCSITYHNIRNKSHVFNLLCCEVRCD